MQTYSDPTRESDPHALPDVEVFHIGANAVPDFFGDDYKQAVMDSWADESTEAAEADAIKSFVGWYWQSCFPGCLPDSDPVGPFETAAEAKADAQDF